MKFQIPFSRNFKYFDKENTEISINYKPKIKELDNFLSQYKDFRIIIFVEEELTERDFTIIPALVELHSNFVIRYFKYSEAIEEKLVSYKIPHFYKDIICNWEDLLGFCSLSVTDIRIGGFLAFLLENTRNFTSKKNIQLRCFCNYCEKKWEAIPAIKNFFIRPEDIKHYAKYIDVFEFEPLNDTFNYNTIYEIYAIDQKWFGRLNEIIYNYTGKEDNRTILPDFGPYRLRCQQKCLININACKFCERIIELGDSLKEKNLIIRLEN